MVLTAILMMLGVTACALVLVAFWGTDLLRLRRERR